MVSSWHSIFTCIITKGFKKVVLFFTKLGNGGIGNGVIYKVG